MRIWTPPPGTKVVFRIQAPAERQIAADFGIKLPRFDHVELLFDDPRWPEFLAALAASSTSGPRRFTSLWLEECPLNPRDQDWARLDPGPSAFRSPARAPKNRHFAWRNGVPLASQTFIDTVLRAGLTGLGWLPLADSHPQDPQRWFEIFAREPIGRGLDHPLMIASLHEAALKERGIDRSRREGEPTVSLPRLDLAKIEHPTLLKMLELAPPQYFCIRGASRFVEESLPRTDFAYSGWDIRSRPEPGYRGRPRRHICCNSKARTALLDAGVMKPTRFNTLVVVSAADAHSEVLDQTISEPIPPPVYTAEEAEAETAKRTALSTGSTLDRPRIRSIRQTVELLQERVADGAWVTVQDSNSSVDFDSGEFTTAPEAWRLVSPLLPDGIYGETPQEDHHFEFEWCVPHWNECAREEPVDDPDERPSKDDLVIAITACGDCFTVRRGSPDWPTEAPVILWDHETDSIHDQWPSIAAFVAHIVAVCDHKRHHESME